MALNSSEIDFIGRGFRILDILEKGNQIWICEMPNNEYALFSGDELAEKIITLLDKYHN